MFAVRPFLYHLRNPMRLRKHVQRFYAVYPYPESDRVPHRDAELLRNSLCQKSWFLAIDYEMTIDSFSGG